MAKYECEACGYKGDQNYNIEEGSEVLRVCKACFDGYQKRHGFYVEQENKYKKTEEEIAKEAYELYRQLYKKKNKKTIKSKPKLELIEQSNQDWLQESDEASSLEQNNASKRSDVDGLGELESSVDLDRADAMIEELEPVLAIDDELKQSILARIGLDDFDIGDIRSEHALSKLLGLVEDKKELDIEVGDYYDTHDYDTHDRDGDTYEDYATNQEVKKRILDRIGLDELENIDNRSEKALNKLFDVGVEYPSNASPVELQVELQEQMQTQLQEQLLQHQEFIGKKQDEFFSQIESQQEIRQKSLQDSLLDIEQQTKETQASLLYQLYMQKEFFEKEQQYLLSSQNEQIQLTKSELDIIKDKLQDNNKHYQEILSVQQEYNRTLEQKEDKIIKALQQLVTEFYVKKEKEEQDRLYAINQDRLDNDDGDVKQAVQNCESEELIKELTIRNQILQQDKDRLSEFSKQLELDKEQLDRDLKNIKELNNNQAISNNASQTIDLTNKINSVDHSKITDLKIKQMQKSIKAMTMVKKVFKAWYWLVFSVVAIIASVIFVAVNSGIEGLFVGLVSLPCLACVWFFVCGINRIYRLSIVALNIRINQRQLVIGKIKGNNFKYLSQEHNLPIVAIAKQLCDLVALVLPIVLNVAIIVLGVLFGFGLIITLPWYLIPIIICSASLIALIALFAIKFVADLFAIILGHNDIEEYKLQIGLDRVDTSEN